jgi:hypothetical protein
MMKKLPGGISKNETLASAGILPFKMLTYKFCQVMVPSTTLSGKWGITKIFEVMSTD